MIIGTPGIAVWRAVAAVRPSIPGIEKSRTITSGFRSRAFSIPSAPPDASPQTASLLSRSSHDFTMFRTSGLSSMMRMPIGIWAPKLCGRGPKAKVKPKILGDAAEAHTPIAVPRTVQSFRNENGLVYSQHRKLAGVAEVLHNGGDGWSASMAGICCGVAGAEDGRTFAAACGAGVWRRRGVRIFRVSAAVATDCDIQFELGVSGVE